MIVVFGSVNVDFVTRVSRIPRPGETTLGPDYAVIPGGKGANQALAARRAGADVALVGAVGQDPFADIALALLRTDGVDCSRVAAVASPTGAAFIAVDDHGENAIVVASGANRQVRADQIEGLTLSSADILLLQREVSEHEAIIAAQRARAAGARVVLNAAPAGPIAEALGLASMSSSSTSTRRGWSARPSGSRVRRMTSPAPSTQRAASPPSSRWARMA